MERIRTTVADTMFSYKEAEITVQVSVGFAIVIVIALLLLVPLLQRQILDFAGRLPGYIDAATNRLLP